MKLEIIARRWFQSSYGNTYHSCRVLVDNELVGFVPFTYGYGEQYLQTALDILQKAGVFKKTGEYLASGLDAGFYNFKNWMYKHSDGDCVIIDCKAVS